MTENTGDSDDTSAFFLLHQTRNLMAQNWLQTVSVILDFSLMSGQRINSIAIESRLCAIGKNIRSVESFRFCLFWEERELIW